MSRFASQLAQWWRGFASQSGAVSPRIEQHDVAGRAPDESAEQRLARLGRWCTGDRLAPAELELFDWLRAPDCPAQAIALLASILASSQRHELAISIIEERLAGPRESEPLLLCTLIALFAAMRNDDAASELTHRLHREHGHDPVAMRWLATLAAPLATSLPSVSDATIDQLAGELLDRIDVIPSLVAALRIERDERTIVMLRGAITQMLRDIDDEPAKLVAYQGLADLAMLAGDHDDARRWAHRGLRLDPYAASLAIILSRITDDPAIGPPASTVLKEAVNAHPRYPDLRAALIRREFAEGRIEIARRRLGQWLQREPNQPMAIRLQGELAA